MKPIDTVTGLPRSAEVSKMLATHGRHGEVESQGQVSAFAREMHGRQTSVNESRKAEGGMVDVEDGGGGGAFHDASDGKHPKEGESEQPAPGSHPVKGKILDIRGS